jgi:hypothetical protein
VLSISVVAERLRPPPSSCRKIRKFQEELDPHASRFRSPAQSRESSGEIAFRAWPTRLRMTELDASKAERALLCRLNVDACCAMHSLKTDPTINPLQK